jgi:ketopantoate reductase
MVLDPLLKQSRRDVLQCQSGSHKFDLLLVATKALAHDPAVQTQCAIVAHEIVLTLLLLDVVHFQKALKVLDCNVR